MSSPETTIGVLQAVDTLRIGGLEHMARDLANLLPRTRCRSYLCTTRGTGPLADGLAEDVETLDLARRHRFDLRALLRLARWVRRRDIRVVHAHGYAVYAALAATAMNPRATVIWHIHTGAWADIERPGRFVRFAARQVAHVFTVTEALAAWCRDRVGVAPDRVSYLPNFLPPRSSASQPAGPEADREPGLPGERGKRLVCVANLRPAKDLPNLIEAMRGAVRHDFGLHLRVVGSGTEDVRASLDQTIRAAGLEANISMLGHRADVPAVLRDADAAILASRSEGFPLVLLEYGMAGLPTVATRVGQCSEILDHGRAGILVEPGDPAALGSAILRLVEPASQVLGERLRQRVSTHYAAGSILERITRRYCDVAGSVR